MRHFIFLLVALLPLYTFAQRGGVKGFVYDKETGEPAIYTNVYLEGTSYGAATDLNGFYSITRIPVGKYTLMVTYLGYDTLKMNIEIKPERSLSRNLHLTPSSIKIDDIVVSAERQEMKQQVHTAVIKINPRQISKLPSVGGEVDIAQYLQVVPGVVFTGDQGGQLYIRGGAPIHNKVKLDGMTIYNPFHSIGMFSVFDSDLLLNADVYTGGFNAQYGGRISSIMDFKTRQGNKKRFTGKFSANTFASRLRLEGPLKKYNEEDASSITYVLSIKKSYLEQSSKTLYQYANEDGLPFDFTDVYGKFSITGKSGNKLNLFGFSFNDNVNYLGLSDLNWGNNGGGMNAVIAPASSNSLIEMNVNFSKYKISMETAQEYPSESAISDFTLSMNVKTFIGNDELEFGANFSSYVTDYAFTNSTGLSISHNQNTAELAVFTRYKGQWGNLLYEPGIRLQYYASLSEGVLEPRLGLKYKITDRLRLKASGGLYSQNLIAANSQRSIVDLFYGFLSSPESIPGEFDGEPIDTKLQKSQHAVGGFEIDLTNKITVNIEGYYKYMYPLININNNKLFDENTLLDVPELLTTKYMIEQGIAYGADFTLKYDYRRWYIWTVCSYGYVDRKGYFLDYNTQEMYMIEYPPHFDRKLTINLLASYTFGKQMNWEVSARWNYGSGFPFTPTAAFYESLTLQNVYDDYADNHGSIGIIYGDINSKRLSSYHRLDLTLKRNFYFGDNGELSVVASVTNLYNRNNIFYVDRIRNEIIYQLPIMPSFGVNLLF